LTKGLSGTGIDATELHAVEVDWLPSSGGPQMKERPGSDFSMRVDLVLLAMGFLHVVHTGLVEQLGLRLNDRGGIAVRDYLTSEEGVFAAGDAAMGASLVVHAINTGRRAAASIDRWLRAGP
jgi:glutamate synthase (NADPH/NADH) small chain